MDDSTTVFVKIPAALDPPARRQAYDEPIHQCLVSRQLGHVLGGGSQLEGDETLEIVWVGIEVVLTKRTEGMRVLCAELVRLGAPRGTEVEFDGGKLAVYPGQDQALDD